MLNQISQPSVIMKLFALVLCLVAAASGKYNFRKNFNSRYLSNNLAAPQLRSPLPQLDGRIIGGEAVFIEDYNYQLSLQYYSSHICGGFIISPLYAVTAAHCTDG